MAQPGARAVPGAPAARSTASGAPPTGAASPVGRAADTASSAPATPTLVQRVRAATVESSDSERGAFAASSDSESDVSGTGVTVTAPGSAFTSNHETVPLRATQGRSTTTATAPTARRSAVPAPEGLRAERPPLRLVSSPSHPAAARALARSVEPGGAGPGQARGVETPTNGARLAAATGAAFSSDPGGFETVVFPQPSGFEAASATISRAPVDGNDDSPPPPPATASSPAPADPPPAASSGGGDIEEIYDQVIERLRRDLLADRERMGDVLGDLP
jgi:hypothetical protein